MVNENKTQCIIISRKTNQQDPDHIQVMNMNIRQAKKYKYLRISYTIFMWGLIIAVVAFAITGVIVANHTTAATSVPTIDY